VTPFVIHANLDVEATWVRMTLPTKIRERISLYASLLAALEPPDVTAPVEVWAPAPVDPRRLLTGRGWTPPVMRVGSPPSPQLVWADARARAVNDRAFALSIATGEGAALPGARVIESIDALADVRGPWVCKAPWTTAGRDRCHGDGPPTTEQRTRLERLLAQFGALMFEPWCDRICDAGIVGFAFAEGSFTAAPHGLITDARGTFLGIDLTTTGLLSAEEEYLGDIAQAVSRALGDAGYRGPFSVDAFVYRGPDAARMLHPLCEINARFTFGHVAHALGTRLGTTRLGFSSAPPADATVLIAPADDGVTAWVA
jgi:hypothetical protein